MLPTLRCKQRIRSKWRRFERTKASRLPVEQGKIIVKVYKRIQIKMRSVNSADFRSRLTVEWRF